MVNSYPYSGDTVYTDGYNLNITSDNSFINETRKDNLLRTSWAEAHDGYYSMLAYQQEVLGSKNLTKTSNAYAFMAAPSEESQLLINAIRTLFDEATPKMIFAADQAEFDAVWEQLQKDLEGFDIEALTAEINENFENAKEACRAYGIEPITAK
jgi:hypothetical protein